MPVDAVDRLRLSRAEGVGPIAYRRLLQRYGTAAKAIDALPTLARAGGRTTPVALPTRASAARELELVEKHGGRMVFIDAPDYPPLLALLDDAPPVLSVKGHSTALEGNAVAIVGGRNASTNGQVIAEELGEALARKGFVVVSGLARGIDGAAHRGALRSGMTVAAVAGGLDVAYPAEHAALQQRIGLEGAVVAEAPFATAPQSRHFPRRNRIIAGLALGVVVIEAAMRSGSLITARIAQDAGRELFAVPGSSLDPRCRGSNDLIRQGAHLTETLTDIVDNLPDHPRREGIARDPLFARPAPPGMAASTEMWTEPPESAAERAYLTKQVLALLGPSPTSVDDLLRRCQMSSAAIIAVLLELELAGYVETLTGNRVVLIAGQTFSAPG
jgi:DNA processing protein